MKIRLFALACTCMCFSCLSAQSLTGIALVDSLEAELANATTSVDSLQLHNLIGKHVAHLDPERGLQSFKAIIHYARQNSDSALLAKALSNTAGPLIYTNQVDSARNNIRHAIRIYRLLANDTLDGQFAYAYMNLGLSYDLLGQMDSAIANYRTALPLSEQDPTVRARLLGNIGAMYASQNQMDSALVSFTSLLNFARDADDKRLLTMALGNLSHVLAEMGQYEQSLHLYREAASVLLAQGDTAAFVRKMADICIVQTDAGHDAAARDTCEMAYALGKQHDVKMAWAFAAQKISELSDESDPAQRRRALSLIEEVLSTVRDEPWSNTSDAYFHTRHAQLLLSDGQHERAYTSARTGLDLLVASHNSGHANRDHVYRVLARTEYLTRRPDSAEAHLALATSIAKNNYLARVNEGITEAEARFGLRETERALDAERSLRVANEEATRAERRLYVIAGALGLLLLIGGLFAYERIRKDRARIADQNAERAVLLREIHHRVKNNLQVITGLLAKQARTSSNEEVRSLMKDGQDRVHSMALVHQRLYEQEDLGSIAASSYFQELAESIRRGQRTSNREVNYTFDIADVDLDMDRAIPLGLILNELLTNAFKYAFKGKTEGSVRIGLVQDNEQYTLTVEDDGSGLPADFEERARHSLGLNLVQGLARQLRGKYSLTKGKAGTGTLATVQF